MNTNKIREAIGLLNSMVYCREQHSERSELVVKVALDELNKPYDIEFLSEQVHNAWWEEKKKQGFHAPIECTSENHKSYMNSSEIGKEKFYDAGHTPELYKWCEKCHLDMYPYNSLAENIKDYDRVTVRTVLDAIKKMEEL